MNHYWILSVAALACIAEQTADLANNDEMYLMLCPQGEIARSNGLFPH